jgi:hypothetical protein
VRLDPFPDQQHTFQMAAGRAPEADHAIRRLADSAWYMPVVVGAGQRLFEDVDTSSLDLRLTDERRLGNGSMILSYTLG